MLRYLRLSIVALTGIFVIGEAAAAQTTSQGLEEKLKKIDVDLLAKTVRQQGDARRGALVFYTSAAACIKCHAGGEAASPLGPDLATIGPDLTDQYVINSILRPSDKIKQGYETVTIYKLDGRVITGLVAADREKEIVLRDAANLDQEIVVKKVDIDEISKGTKSMMPEGLVAALRDASAAVIGDTSGLTWEIDAQRRIVLTIPVGDKPRVFRLLRSAGNGREALQQFEQSAAAAATQTLADPKETTRGGPARWPQKIAFAGSLGAPINGYALDTIPVPFENPWNAWLRTSALDFFPDGRCVVTTHGGDVYIVIWMPQELDSSCGGQVWADDPRWGPLAGRLIHSSFGKGWLYYLSLQEVDGRLPGSIVKLPHQWEAGVMRLRVNPQDGQVYGTGLSGWQGPPGGKDGCLQRLRYTGDRARIIENVRITRAEIDLAFNFALDESVASEPSAWNAEMWNYLWSSKYGSDQFMVSKPEQKGHDKLRIDSVQLANGKRTARLTIPNLAVCNQLLLTMKRKEATGKDFTEQVYLTVHAIPEKKEGNPKR